MATSAVAKLHSFDRQQSLLNLDCSADLRSYSRNLGPGVQEKLFQRTSDTLRAQLDEHRDFLLRHQRNSQMQINPVPRVNAPNPLTVPRPWSHTLPSHEPAQPLARSPTPPPPQSPVLGDINTYPPALRAALEQCTAVQQPEDNIVYRVMFEVQGAYAGHDVHDIAGTYDSLQEANEQVVQMFLFDGTYSSGASAGYEADYEVEGGALSCAIETDGSTGGYTQIYVRRVNLPGVKRSRRR